MDTVSLLVYRRAHAVRPWILLVGLVWIGLILLAAGALGVDGLLPHEADDRLMAPFRWSRVAANLA